jgi:DNA-binding winged helix-turn-helix (wHTH) protein
MLWKSNSAEPQDWEVQASRVRIGEFEVDLRAGELRARGETRRLQEQPFQVFLMLLKRAGEVVTREEICRELWADGTVVEFDHSINSAIRKLRRALGDSADCPRYIETVARRGYRVLMPVQWAERENSAPVQPQEREPDTRRLSQLSRAPRSEDTARGERLRSRYRGSGTHSLSLLEPSSPSAAHKPRRRLGQQLVVLVQTPELQQRLRRLERLVYGRMRRSRGFRLTA